MQTKEMQPPEHAAVTLALELTGHQVFFVAEQQARHLDISKSE